MKTNPVRTQNRAEDLIDNWRKYGYVMFPQQRAIYERLHRELCGSILEAGCGAGHGVALFSVSLARLECSHEIVGTDKNVDNCDFAKCLYPWVEFQQWDIEQPWPGEQFDNVVAVEVIEHVGDPQAAVRNLIAAAKREVWISTPNGKGKPRPPENPEHVCEYTVEEIVGMIKVVAKDRNAADPRLLLSYDVLGWEDFKPVPHDTNINPLVYRIRLR